MKSWHMLLCVAFVVASVVLVAAGAGALVFLPILGCAAMMGAMVWMMVRSGGPGGN
jgi:H+/Cl- antiporter ClcA